MRAPFSLRGKMLAFTVGVVAVLAGLSLAVVHYFVARQTSAEVVEDLARTKSVFEKFMAERALWLRSACLVVAEDPRFTAPLDIDSPQLDLQARTVLREARRFQGIIGGDHFLVTDGKGRVLARIDVLTEPSGTLLAAPTVARALRGEATTGRWTREGLEYQVATAPVRDGPQVAGTLTVGFAEALAEADLMEALHGAETFHDLRKALAPDRPADAASLALQIQRDLDADVVALTDAAGIGRGVVVRRAGWGGVVSDPRVLEALEGREFVGLRTEGERIAQMVIVPVWSRGQVIGALGTGFEIDDRLAGDLGAMTRSDVSFAVGGRVVASTWPEAVRREIERALAGNPAAGERPFEMPLGDETYLSLLGRLTLPEASPGGIYLIQRSLDQAVGFLTTMQQVLLFVGAGVLVAAGVISYAGVARIVQPVRALVEGTRLVAAGNLAHRISASSRDEIGELAGAFNEMAAALATSRDTLAESERRYRDLFDHAQDVVYTTDLEMRLTSVNEAGLERLGYPADELVGRSFYDLLTTAEAARIAAEDRRLPPGAPRPAFEAVVRRKDGTEATLEFVSRWIIEGGQPVGVHGIGRDISERRDREQATNRFREQMHQAEKLRALGEMAAGVAHNFNNLLQGVMGYAELMESRARTTEAYQRYARKVVASAQQCAAIVKRIQTFGRPTDIDRKDQVDLSRVVRDTVELTRPKWKSGPEREGRSIEVVLALEDVPAIESSGAAWEEIISNLVFNGVDAMPDGGTLTVATREEGGECVLEVRDTGTGMDEETQRRIFEPFFTTKGPELGTGLGLSTVWGLVQGHGGRIEVDSAPGRGTTFTIRVRPAVEPAPPPLPERAVRADVSVLRILIVDDEPSVRELLAEMLSGHAVDAVGSGTDALERFGDGRYDAVISDWSMAGLSGLEVAAEVKRRAPETVTILMTGWEVRGSAAARSPDVDLLLQKPITMGELDRIVAEAIDLRARSREGRPA